jgi:hypothetical protein
MFVKLEGDQPSKYPITEENLKILFPNHTFPNIYTPDFVKSLGFGMYEFTQIPYQEYPNIADEDFPTLGSNGIYYQRWIVRPMTESERETATFERARKVRVERMLSLSRCDWTQLPDTGLSEESRTNWTLYRQKLRDLPQQEGFPWAVTWPIPPDA